MPHGRLLAVVLAVFALIAGVVATAPLAGGQSSMVSTIKRVPSFEELVLRQVNAARTANGVGQLVRSSPLTKAAAAHSRAMATFGFFAHSSRDGASFSTRIRRFYEPRSGLWTVGENLAMTSGSFSAEAIVSSWLGSSGHRANLLAEQYREAGVAIVHHPAAGGVFGGQPTWVVTLDVGRR